MKYVFAVFSALVAMACILQAQTDTGAVRSTLPAGSKQLKGIHLLKIDGSYEYSHYDGGWSSYSVSAANIDVDWRIFPIDQIAVGVQGQFAHLSSSDSHAGSTNLFGIGPQIGFYYGERNTRITPFVEAGYSYVRTNHGGWGQGDNAFKAGGGAIFQIASHIGITMGLDYLKYSSENAAYHILGTLGLVAKIY
jgi:hypothetical protein